MNKYFSTIMLMVYLVLPSYAGNIAFRNFDGITSRLCVRDITQSSDGMMWLAAESGLYSFDGYHLMEHPLVIGGKQRPRGYGSFNKICSMGDSLLIGCNAGVLSFNLKSYTYRQLPYAHEEVVNGIIAQNGSIWVSTTMAVYCNWKKLLPSVSGALGMGCYGQQLFIGSDDQAYIYNRVKKTMTSIGLNRTYVNCFQAEGDNLWIGTANRLFLFSNHDRKPIGSWPMPVVKTLCIDAQKHLFVGTDDGLFIREGVSFRPVLHDARYNNSLAGDAVWCIFNDHENIWLGTNSGLSMMINQALQTEYLLPAITGDGEGNVLTTVFGDSRGRIWLGGSNGLICIEHLGENQQTYRWYKMDSKQYPLKHNQVRCITENSQGRIFLGGDMGILMLDEQTKQFKQYTIDEDPHNWVYNIHTLDNDLVEVTTLQATYLVRLQKGKVDVVTKSAARNLDQQKEKQVRLLEKYGMEENYLSAYEDSRHKHLIIGGKDRFAIIPLQSNRKSTRMLAITDVVIHGKIRVSHEDIIARRVTMEADDAYAEISFSDFNFARFPSVHYHYRLDDGGWIPLKSDQYTVTLSNLSAGSHILEISSLQNSAKNIKITIDVKPRWYATTWAKCLYALLVGLIICGVRLIIIQRRRLNTECKERVRLLKEAQENERELLNNNKYLADQLRLQLYGLDNEGELSEDEHLLKKFSQFIEEHISDTDLNVDMLAHNFGLSSKSLYRKVKAVTGLTTVAYIRDQRLKKAAWLLTNGAFNVSEVMYMVGFSNPSYFARCFQDAYDSSPSEYQESHKSDKT